MSGLESVLSKAAKAVVAAEDDRSTCDSIVAKGYEISKGIYTVSNEPGLGIDVQQDIYREKYKQGEIVIS